LVLRGPHVEATRSANFSKSSACHVGHTQTSPTHHSSLLFPVFK